MFINFATSAAGSIKIEIQDEYGTPLNEYGLEDCNVIIGNEIKKLVSWKGKSDLNKIAGKIVKLKFFLKDSDLFSIKFE